MKISLEIPDFLVCAVVNSIMENFPEASSGNALSCVKWNYKNSLFVFDDCEARKTYVVNKAALIAAFELLFTDKWHKGCTPPPVSDSGEIWDNWLCQCDAIDHDAFVQLAIFGEVIYG